MNSRIQTELKGSNRTQGSKLDSRAELLFACKQSCSSLASRAASSLDTTLYERSLTFRLQLQSIRNCDIYEKSILLVFLILRFYMIFKRILSSRLQSEPKDVSRTHVGSQAEQLLASRAALRLHIGGHPKA